MTAAEAMARPPDTPVYRAFWSDERVEEIRSVLPPTQEGPGLLRWPDGAQRRWYALNYDELYHSPEQALHHHVRWLREKADRLAELARNPATREETPCTATA